MGVIIRKQTIRVRQPDEFDLLSLKARFQSNPNAPEVLRVQKIMELMSELRPGDTSDGRGRVLGALRNSLSRYRWVQQISPNTEGFGVVTFPADREKLSGWEKWEAETVRFLLTATPHLGKHPRIRRCADPTCNRWLFALNRNDQKFCNDNCKQHNYDNDPLRREKKRIAAREAYTRQKERERKAKEAISYRGRPQRSKPR